MSYQNSKEPPADHWAWPAWLMRVQGDEMAARGVLAWLAGSDFTRAIALRDELFPYDQGQPGFF